MRCAGELGSCCWMCSAPEMRLVSQAILASSLVQLASSQQHHDHSMPTPMPTFPRLQEGYVVENIFFREDSISAAKTSCCWSKEVFGPHDANSEINTNYHHHNHASHHHHSARLELYSSCLANQCNQSSSNDIKQQQQQQPTNKTTPNDLFLSKNLTTPPPSRSILLHQQYHRQWIKLHSITIHPPPKLATYQKIHPSHHRSGNVDWIRYTRLPRLKRLVL